MFQPMYEPTVGTAGVPAFVVIAAIALAVAVVGLLWIRRITSGDPEIKSFWATDGGSRRLNPPLIAGLVLAVAATALVITFRS